MKLETTSSNDQKIQDELLARIHKSAHAHYGDNLPAEVKERMDTEINHLFQNGQASVLASVVKIADLSEELGYPIGFRGYFCNLFLAYLLDLVPENPLDYNLPWEALLGLNGEKELTAHIDVAGEVLQKAEELDLCPQVVLYDNNSLFSDIGRFRQLTQLNYREIDVTSEKLIRVTYYKTICGILEFDTDYFQELAQKLHPRTLEELAKIIGMCHGTNIWIPVQKSFYENSEHKKELRKDLIGSAEDVFDMCLKHGIKREDAFGITNEIRRGKADLLTEVETDLLNRADLPQIFVDTIQQIGYLFSKGQALNYAHWNLVLLQYRLNEGLDASDALPD